MTCMTFICPYYPEHHFDTYSGFLDCSGCADGHCPDSPFGCQLVELYAHTAYLNNLHRDNVD